MRDNLNERIAYLERSNKRLYEIIGESEEPTLPPAAAWDSPDPHFAFQLKVDDLRRKLTEMLRLKMKWKNQAVGFFKLLEPWKNKTISELDHLNNNRAIKTECESYDLLLKSERE